MAPNITVSRADHLMGEFRSELDSARDGLDGNGRRALDRAEVLAQSAIDEARIEGWYDILHPTLAAVAGAALLAGAAVVLAITEGWTWAIIPAGTSAAMAFATNLRIRNLR